MSLRLRLALWYGALTAIVVLSLSSAAYLVHSRSLYDDLDRALADDAAHFAPLLELVAGTADELTLRRATGHVTSFVRLYDAAGAAIGPSGTEARQPPLAVADALAQPRDVAYGAPLAWLPGGGVHTPGTFSTAAADRDGARTRVYVLPVGATDRPSGYVQTWASLTPVDRAAAHFRWLLAGFGTASVLVVVLAGYAISGPAVRPVGDMIRTAQGIARSRDFRRRVPQPVTPRGDELAHLARTFNDMLAALEASYVAQQRFLADAAHELRAPLTGILGNVELLDRVHEMPEADRREAIAALHSQAALLARLVDDLLQLARSDAGQRARLEPVPLHEVVTRAIADLGAAPDARRVSLDALEPLTVDGDPDRLRQAFGALLDNARKYTPPPAAVRVALRRARGEAVLTVSDDGVGIDAEALPHVFERFFRATPALPHDPGGTGLGLAIAQSVVAQHGGRIEIASRRHRGTTATIHLPLAPVRPAGPPAASASPSPVASSADARAAR